MVSAYGLKDCVEEFWDVYGLHGAGLCCLRAFTVLEYLV